MKVLVILALVGWLNVSLGFPDGAPEEACVDMVPQHEVDPTPGGNDKFDIRAEDNGDGTATVTLESIDGTEFKGFFLQAHDPATHEPVGTFTIDAAVGQARPCPADGPDNGVTHVDATNLNTEVTATFTGDFDSVHFVATVVVAFDEIYVMIGDDHSTA